MAHRALVSGGRDYRNARRLYAILDHYRSQIGIVIQGCAEGVDSFARKWCIDRGVPFLDYPAEAFKSPNERNRQMILRGYPTVGIIFPGGRGTADMCERLQACNIPIVRVI
jgi:hypothetical protein